MQKVNVQTSLSDIYEDVRNSMEENPTSFLKRLKEHIKMETLIPKEFYEAADREITDLSHSYGFIN